MRNHIKLMDFITYLKTHIDAPIYPLKFPTNSPDKSVIVEFNGGSPSGVVGTVYVQFTVRAPHPKDGELLSDEILDLLDKKTNTDIGGKQLILSEAQQMEPFYIGTDDNDRALFTINFKLLIG